MHALSRYLRLWFALGPLRLVRELAFRGKLLVKITVEMLWFAILLIFWETVYAQTSLIAGWSKSEYSSSSAATTPWKACSKPSS